MLYLLHSLKRIFKYSVNYNIVNIQRDFVVLQNYCIIFKKKKICHTFLEFHFTKHLVTRLLKVSFLLRYLHLDRTLIIPKLRHVKNADCTVDLIAPGNLHMPNCMTRASSFLIVSKQAFLSRILNF